MPLGARSFHCSFSKVIVSVSKYDVLDTWSHLDNINLGNSLSLRSLLAYVFQLHLRRGAEQSESVLSNAGIYNRLLAPTGWFSNQSEIIVVVKRAILSMGHSSKPTTQRYYGTVTNVAPRISLGTRDSGN